MKSVSYAEALEVALCFGWIDSQKRGFDEKSFLQRFTPRRPRGRWSRINREKAEGLIEAGRMRPPGWPRSRRRRPTAAGRTPTRASAPPRSPPICSASSIATPRPRVLLPTRQRQSLRDRLPPRGGEEGRDAGAAPEKIRRDAGAGGEDPWLRARGSRSTSPWSEPASPGLRAARALADAGREVVVLEARDRVGGRLLNTTLGEGVTVDVGGQWVGSDHARVQRLAGELGVESSPSTAPGATCSTSAASGGATAARSRASGHASSGTSSSPAAASTAWRGPSAPSSPGRRSGPRSSTARRSPSGASATCARRSPAS